jgi:hypothetical protein
MADSTKGKDFKRWRDRLRYAKKTWVDHGILGSQHPSHMRLLIEFYRGNQWAHLSGIPGIHEDHLASVNKIFPIANTLHGDVASRNPQVQVFPRTDDSIPKALPVENLINYDIEELNFKRQTNRALAYHLFGPFGVVRHGFTPPEEFESESGRRMQMYRPAKSARPWIRAVKPWNVLFDPSCDYFHPDEGLEWVAFRDVMLLADIKDNPNMIARDQLKDFQGNISQEWKDMQYGHHDAGDDPDMKNKVEVFTVYEARERTWFQMTLDGVDNYLRDPDDWPIDWETLPVSIFQVNEQMDTPFTLPIMDQCPSIQQELNRLRSMMGELVFRLRRLIGVQATGMDDAEINKIEDGAINEIIKTKASPKEVIQLITSGVFPQELLQYEALLEEDMREVVGQSKMGRAQRINVETAHEVERVQQGQDVSTGRIVDAFETFNQEIIRLYMQGRRATMDITGAEIVRIVGQQDENGIQAWGQVAPGDLHGDFDFNVVHGSTRPRDRDREAQKAAADFQLAFNAPDIFKAAFFARKYLEARGIDPTRGLTDQALTASAVRTLDTIRRNAQPGGEAAAAGPQIDPNIAAALGGGGGGLTQ